MQAAGKLDIPILDLKAEVAEHWEDLIAAVESVLRSGEYIMGPQVKAFESEIARYLDVEHAVGVNSGTDALVIALRAMGVGPGDEVITSPFTFFATAEAVLAVGATPVFVDVDPVSFNLDPAGIEPAITSRTRAILPVHLYGQSADMAAILAIAEAYGLKVLEDVAQAMGGTYRDRKVGTIGDAGAFSFFPSKNLGGFGDGGLIATNDGAVAETARMLRVHGARKKYFNEVAGYNSRLDELQAALLRVKLPNLDRANEARYRAAERYGTLLAGLPLTLPTEAPYARHVYHQYTVRVADGRRDELQRRLAEAGIGTMIYYPVPVHRLPLYHDAAFCLPVAELAASEALSLPLGPALGATDQEAVAKAIRQALR